jgi:hypothetical protein
MQAGAAFDDDVSEARANASITAQTIAATDIARSKRYPLTAALLVLCLTAAPSAHAASAPASQTTAGPSGHWVGTMTGPGIEIEIDLAPKGDVWRGTMSIPAQGIKGVPLSELTVKGTAVSFIIKGAPGDPAFSGTLAPDGKTISGTFTQGGGATPLALAWKGEPKFEVPQKSTAITKDLEGSWEGSIDLKGTMLRLALKLANGANGATGAIISLDQGNVEIPISTVTQDGSRLKLLVTMISGTYDGELKGGELAGTWNQGALSVPLVFKRAAK